MKVTSAALTFQDVIAFIETMDSSIATQRSLKTHMRQIAWGLLTVTARHTGQSVDPSYKNPELTRIAFDLPAINRALEGLSYRMAGFTSDKSYRNAKSGLRRVGRALGLVVPFHAPDLPADSPYARFIAVADTFEVASARRFAVWMAQQERAPMDVRREDLERYGVFLATEMVGVRIKPMLRRIIHLWKTTAALHPDWPQTPLTLGGPVKPFNPPFSAYPRSLQDEIAALRSWMAGTNRLGPFETQCARKSLRPKTIQHRLYCLRLILGVHVCLGHSPQSVAHLNDLLSPEVIQPILQTLWERGQARQQALPEDRRMPGETSNTGQLDAVGGTFLMLVEHVPLTADVQKKIQALVKKIRKPQPSSMTRKNRRRVDQFLDPLKRSLLLNVPRTLMTEALTLREHQPVEAARLARAAVFFAIELRIPLRMQNLHTIRLGYNLRFAGGGSPIAILSFQGHEMKNKQAIEFGVGARLCQILQTYIECFLPAFAAKSPDFVAMQWLFPAGDGKSGPLTHGQVRKTIIDTVAERVGAEFNPHLFRALAVDFCLQHDPGALEHCRQLLGDKTLQVVLASYAPIRTRQASDHQDKLVNEEADRLAHLAPRIKRSRTARNTSRIGGQS